LFEGFEDIAPSEQDGVTDLDVRQIALSHPLLNAARGFLEPGRQFAFGEQFIGIGGPRRQWWR